MASDIAGTSTVSRTTAAQPVRRSSARNAAAQLLSGTASETLTTSKLEKHLSDYRSGNGNLSKETAATIFDKEGLNGSFLAANYPKLLASYSGYVSGMRYDERSRFVKGVNGANDTLARVLSAGTGTPTAKEIEALYEPPESTAVTGSAVQKVA